MCIDDNNGVTPMIKQKLTALTLAGLLAAAAGSAFAGSTGTTDPVDNNSAPKTSTRSLGQNADGSTPGNTSTPGTKGMNNSGTGTPPASGGMTNGSGMGGNGGGGEGGNSGGGSGGASK
jgi:hypothetical protein